MPPLRKQRTSLRKHIARVIIFVAVANLAYTLVTRAADFPAVVRSALRKRGSSGPRRPPPTREVINALRGTPQSHDTARVAICAVIKDEPEDIPEWMAHHQRLGIGRFYIFDNGSDPPLNASLTQHIASGLVKMYRFEHVDLELSPHNSTQLAVYDICNQAFGRRHKWLAFIDPDEFLIIRDSSPDLPRLLDDFREFGGVCVFETIFGSNGLIERPEAGVLASYDWCVPASNNESYFVKSIANTDFMTGIWDPHIMKYRDGKECVTTDKKQVVGGGHALGTEHTRSRLVIHHYVVKSLEDFEAKRKRGNVYSLGRRPSVFISLVDELATDRCRDAWDLGYVRQPSVKPWRP